jgi:hypothetical protein
VGRVGLLAQAVGQDQPGSVVRPVEDGGQERLAIGQADPKDRGIGQEATPRVSYG